MVEDDEIENTKVGDEYTSETNNKCTYQRIVKYLI